MKFHVSCNYTSSVRGAGSRLGALTLTGPNEASRVLQPVPCDSISPPLWVKEEAPARLGEQQRHDNGGVH